MKKICLLMIIIMAAALAGCDSGIYSSGGPVNATIENNTDNTDDWYVSVYLIKTDKDPELLGEIDPGYVEVFELNSGECLEFEGPTNDRFVEWGILECFYEDRTVTLTLD
ncbi:MAG: hypothetical protein ACLFP1_05230 [Candidatus Goldiibacteriota bacterium]